MIDILINRIMKYNGKLYYVFERYDDTCYSGLGCDIMGNCGNISCLKSYRKDKKSAGYKEIKSIIPW